MTGGDLHRPSMGSGGHGGGMSDLDESLEAKLDALRVDLAELNDKVSQLPTVWTMALVNFGLAVTVPALVFVIAQAMK